MFSIRRSGRPVERVIGATVVAERGADADALAKVCSVLEPEESLRLVNSLPGVECLIVTADGQVARSAGWHDLERPRPWRRHGSAARRSRTPQATAARTKTAEPGEG